MRGMPSAAWFAALAFAFSTVVAEPGPDGEHLSPEELTNECERFEHGDPARAIDLALRAEAALVSEPDPAILHRALGCRAWALTSKGRTAEARALLEPMKGLSEQLLEPSDQVTALRRMAAIYHRIGDVSSTTDFLGRALRIAERHDLRTLRIGLLANMGVLHSEGGQHDLAKQYYYRALELWEPGDDPGQQLPIRYNLGLTYRGAGNLDSASEVLGGLIDSLEEPGMEVRLASLLLTLGIIEQQRGELDAAEAYFSRSAMLHEELANPSEYSSLLSSQAGLYLARGQVDQALERSEQALKMARKSDHQFTIRDALRIRSNALVAAGRHAEAIPLERERAELTEQYLRDQQRSRLNELEAELGVALRERELVALRRDRDLQRVELERQVQRQQIGMVLVIGFVVLVLGLVLWQRGHNRHLHRLSRTDLLTGLPNRRRMTEWLGQADKDGRITVMLLDLDHFKQINDNYGHDLGDRALIALAGCLRRFALEHAAQAGRWGGEEFLLLIRVSEADKAAKLAGVLLEQIAGVEIARASGPPLQFTASLGFSPLKSTKRHSGQELWEPALLIADQMMYRAKHAGRSRYCGAWPTSPDVALHPRRLEEQVRMGECRVLDGAVGG
ncbi:MAG: diguanylate cyclase [Wenzhouxiangella sp.]|nr:MAG: diguanylate cyclase [Wenzhouxiangella sp.]